MIGLRAGRGRVWRAATAAALLVAALGCRPVLAVGWQELLVLVVIVVVLVGPVLFRLYRFMLRSRDEKEDGER